MYNHIEGKLVEKSPTQAVIDCSGVGYLLHISLYTFSKLPASGNCKLLAHLSVKEDSHTLYGFIDEAERTLFRHLISVNGVGASTARVMLSSMSAAEIQQAITQNNPGALQSIKGIGAKTALRIIIDLRDKLTKVGSLEDLNLGSNNTNKQEALSALVALGFNKLSAEKALDRSIKTMAGEMNVEQLIKSALKFL